MVLGDVFCECSVFLFGLVVDFLLVEFVIFLFQAYDGMQKATGVQTWALPSLHWRPRGLLREAASGSRKTRNPRIPGGLGVGKSAFRGKG